MAGRSDNLLDESQQILYGLQPRVPEAERAVDDDRVRLTQEQYAIMNFLSDHPGAGLLEIMQGADLSMLGSCSELLRQMTRMRILISAKDEQYNPTYFINFDFHWRAP